MQSNQQQHSLLRFVFVSETKNRSQTSLPNGQLVFWILSMKDDSNQYELRTSIKSPFVYEGKSTNIFYNFSLRIQNFKRHNDKDKNVIG